MNESEKRGTVGEAVFGIIFIFIILVFVLYRFGTTKDTIVNNTLSDEQISKEDFYRQLDTKQDEEIYSRYIKQIYDSQNPSLESDQVVNNETKIDQIVQDYQDELKSKVTVPFPAFTLNNISLTDDKRNYTVEFEKLFTELKKAGGTSESQIFNSQITNEGSLLTLADYDRETLLRIATEYELFTDKLQNLATPKSVSKNVIELGNAAINVSYILRKMVVENDTKVYSLWITKYTENMSVIITNRYGLQ